MSAVRSAGIRTRRSGVWVAPSALLVALGLAAAACSGGGSNGSAAYGGAASQTTAASASVVVGVVTDAGLGQILADGQQRTVYLFEQDAGGQPSCYDACAAAWPPLLADGAPGVGGAADGSLVGTVARTDGTEQVTYAGHPLYYYRGDSKPGDTNGQAVDAFGAEWYVVSPDGQVVEGSG